MPGEACVKRETPAACRVTNRALSRVRRIGPGVGDHASPPSSSLKKRASAVGSVTGSLAKGVRRFSRLFSAHVYAEPDAETTVPKPGLAMTFTQGSGVSRSPSRTTAYSRPPSAKPPVPLAKVRSEEHTSELQSPCNLVCRLLLEKKKKKYATNNRHKE